MSGSLAAAIALAATPSPAQVQSAAGEMELALKRADAPNREVRAFYAGRGYRPLWIRGSSLSPAAETFLQLVRNADLDGLDPDDYRPQALASAVRKARGASPKALAKAEMLLSQRFAAYVRDVTRPRDTGMVYAEPALAPSAVTLQDVLEAAAAAPSLEQYVRDTGWSHPIYSQLRRALAARATGLIGERQERLLRLNMDRARALPADRGQRYVLVDAAGSRLWMFENGRVKDTMRVVVGKPTEQTPMMAGLLRYAIANPYWNVPTDLVRTRVAPYVLSDGLGYLKVKGYQVLSDFTDDAKVVDPRKIDWRAVADGHQQVRVRQLPGPANAMGKVKFMFPNDLGIYLHDTPDRELFDEAARRFSAGCVRLEDAAKLAKWLYGKPLATKSPKPEQRISLPKPVPVYITYLTAAPEGDRIVFRDDPYNRDAPRLAQRGSRGFAGR